MNKRAASSAVKLIVEVELAEKDAALLDRYMEEGCYDRGKIIRRWILEKVREMERDGLPCRREDHRHLFDAALLA